MPERVAGYSVWTSASHRWRMYDLLDYSRRERTDVPFLCVRIQDEEVPRLSKRAIAMAAESAGAAAFIDFADLLAKRGVSAAEQHLETEVLTRLADRERPIG